MEGRLTASQQSNLEVAIGAKRLELKAIFGAAIDVALAVPTSRAREFQFARRQRDFVFLRRWNLSVVLVA